MDSKRFKLLSIIFLLYEATVHNLRIIKNQEFYCFLDDFENAVRAYNGGN
jgi:hypothetical protein